MDDNSVAERIRRLFDAEAQPERVLDDKLEASIQGFLRATVAGSALDFDELSREYGSAAVPDAPVSVDDYFAMLVERVVPHSDHVASPRYLGHMTSALPFFVRPLGRLLTALNQNLVKVETSKALTPYERQALGMIHRIFYDRDSAFYAEHLQHKDSTLAIMTSGGTLANATALWIARNASLPGVEADGMAAALEKSGARRAVVIGSSLMHYSLDKAADFLGIGRDGFLTVPVDKRGRVVASDVERAVRRARDDGDLVVAVVGVAGTTDSGTIDPLDELAEVARNAGVHFHVDAAWGGPLAFSRTHRHLLRGIERADSITVDGHKQLYLPMGMGICVLKDPAVARVIEKQAQYIIRSDSADLGKRALEGSRAGIALYLHAALHILGREGYEHLIDEGIRKARYLASAVRARPEYELLVEPEINIVNYRYVPNSIRTKVRAGDAVTREETEHANALNRRIQELQRQHGRTFVSRTTLRLARYREPVVAFRAVLANPRTVEADIDAALDDGLAIAADIEREQSGG